MRIPHARRLFRFGAAFVLMMMAGLGPSPCWSLANAADADSHPHSGRQGPSVEDSVRALVTQTGVRVEIAAHEPNVIDPVAIRFDDRGRMWVVEMRDYPTGPTDGDDFGGRIRILSDADGDGFFEVSQTFVAGLCFPTGLQPWRNGVIVTLAGAIEFMADDDGDGKCDRREVWFRGFEEDNEQLRANHPTQGPDGRVYVANGLRGGSVTAVDDRWSVDSAEDDSRAVDLNGRDFVFDPRGGEWGTVAGNSQFGMSIDDFGRRVGCSNRNPAFESLLTLRDLKRDRWSGPTDALHDIALPAGDSTVNALAQTWTTSHSHAGQFSAACGVTVGMGMAMPKSWQDDLVVCEPTSFAVQRQRIERLPIGRTSHRIEGKREMLASRDDWFRPVDTAIGPDGALYVVDMCRAVIEHPHWAPKELQQRPDERWGNNRGRIWRVISDGVQRESPELALAEDWMELLSHRNPVQRQLATAHGVNLPAGQVVPALREWIADETSHSDVGLARAIGVLRAFDAVDWATIQVGLVHRSPKIRCLIIECLRESDWQTIPAATRREALRGLLEDSDDWVRFDALGLASDWCESVSSVATLVVNLIQRQEIAPWWQQRFACLNPSLAKETVVVWLSDRKEQAMSAEHCQLLFTLVRMAGSSEALSDIKFTPRNLDDRIAIALVAGHCEGSASRVVENESASRWFNHAAKIAPKMVLDASLPLADRLRALDVMVVLGTPSQDCFRAVLLGKAPPAMKVAVAPMLIRSGDTETMQFLRSSIASLQPDLRSASIDAMCRSNATATMVLSWIEAGQLPATLLTADQMKQLQDHEDSEIRSRASRWITASRSDRNTVIDEYADSLVGTADLQKGWEVFKQHCATCHGVGDWGIHVGPDVSDSRTKTPAALLTAILDPNAAIDAGFLAYQVLSTEGNIVTGSLIDEGSDRVILQVAGGERKVIARDEIETFQTTGVSLMPEGFERSLDVDQMRDLIGYLKGWRYLDSSRSTIEMEEL